jgi:hypothetical protein
VILRFLALGPGALALDEGLRGPKQVAGAVDARGVPVLGLFSLEVDQHELRVVGRAQRVPGELGGVLLDQQQLPHRLLELPVELCGAGAGG